MFLVYAPERESLRPVRQVILHDPDSFRGAISSPEFIAAFGKLQGETNKLIPVEYLDVYVNLPEISLKQFYYRAEFPPESML